MWSDWGAELPLWEAFFELDPPIEERTDNAAWQIARAARVRGTIYRSEFDGRQRPPTEPQSPEEMAKVAVAVAKSWPHREKSTKFEAPKSQ